MSALRENGFKYLRSASQLPVHSWHHIELVQITKNTTALSIFLDDVVMSVKRPLNQHSTPRCDHMWPGNESFMWKWINIFSALFVRPTKQPSEGKASERGRTCVLSVSPQVCRRPRRPSPGCQGSSSRFSPFSCQSWEWDESVWATVQLRRHRHEMEQGEEEELVEISLSLFSTWACHAKLSCLILKLFL